MKGLERHRNSDLRRYIARRGLFIQQPIPEKMKSLEPEIALGRAILDRAVLDAAEGDQEAIDFFDLDNERFIEICFIAYLDHEIVEKQFKLVHQRILNGDVIGNLFEKLLEV